MTVAAWPAASLKKTVSKKKTASKKLTAASKKLTMMHDPVLECRHGKYKALENECHNKTGKCTPDSALATAVQKCQVYGIGTPDWPMNDVWPLPQERVVALKAKGYNLQKARRCLTSAFWETHEEDLKKCGQTKRDLERQQQQLLLPPMKVNSFKPLGSARRVSTVKSTKQALPFFAQLSRKSARVQ